MTTNTTVTLAQFVRDRIAEGEQDQETIARAYVADSLASDDPTERLVWPVHAAIQAQFRGLVKARERQLGKFEPPAPESDTEPEPSSGTVDKKEESSAPATSASTTSPAKPESAVSERERNCRAVRFVPGEGYLPTGVLTTAQLGKIIEFYQVRIAGHQDTIDFVQSGIDAINATPGAECLNEVYGFNPEI